MTDRLNQVEQRLAHFIREKRDKGDLVYEVYRAPATVLVREKDTGDEIECTIPDGCTCIHWHLGTGLFGFLQKDRNADGVLLVCRPDGTAEAHIIECKTTMGHLTWSTVVEQMRWTACRLLALTAVLGVHVEKIVLVTAFRHDAAAKDTSPNPAYGRRKILPAAESNEENVAARVLSAWEHSEVELYGFSEPFPHTKIELDKQTGRAKHSL